MNLFNEAREVIAGGVNSPVRAFAGVGGDPVFFKSANGAWLETEDGQRLIDYVGSWGPMILGHCHPDVVEAVVRTAKNGLSFGAPCVLETQIATKIRELMPSIERIRMVSSGTEATMSAIRLARGHTRRDKIIKFEGLLSRAFGLAADQGRLRRFNTGCAQLTRCTCGPRRKYDHAALQRCRRSPDGIRRAW